MSLPAPQNMLLEAAKAAEKAYAPYSKFSVGCALFLKDGTVLHGANIENASYSLTICAERVALCCAVMDQKAQDIIGVSIYADAAAPCSPCGPCRQALLELVPKSVPIVFGNKKGQYLTKSLLDLLPEPFDASFL